MNMKGAQNLVQMLLEDDLQVEGSSLPHIDGYTIVEQIGCGGGGVVYEGIALATGRRVAVKFARPGSKNTLSKTLLEIDRLVAVGSSVVPHVYEHGVIGGRVYMVTELIEGVSPIEFVEGLGLRERVELLVKIADATGELNGYGLIHRDLKPSNIMVNKSGKPVILDLGISVASELDDLEMIDHAGKPIGTLAYMAPEQARGETGEISIQWDVYALGAIAYRLLTGSTPHELPESMTMGVERVSQQRARSARELNPKIPRQLASVLEKACAWDKNERYESAQFFRDDLRRWLNREPVNAGHQSPWAQVVRMSYKHPVLSMLCMSAIILLGTALGTVGIVWWQSIKPYGFEWVGTGATNRTAIVSRSGRELHVWETDERKGIQFPGKILSLEGKKYAILGLQFQDAHSGVRGLVGYRLGEYDSPAWVATQEVPDALSYAVRFEPGPHVFAFTELTFADVFEDIPGLEIISIHRQQRNSVGVIQVHRANGDLLCEYYHDGWLRDVYWEPVNKELIATGQNSDGTSVERGSEEEWAGKYPIVVFAVKPQVGEVGWTIQHPGLPVGEAPLWYTCLLPGEIYSDVYADKSFCVQSLHKTKSKAESKIGHIDFVVGNPVGDHIVLEIDSKGTMVDVWGTDGWADVHGFPPDRFYLGDMPERVIRP